MSISSDFLFGVSNKATYRLSLNIHTILELLFVLYFSQLRLLHFIIFLLQKLLLLIKFIIVQFPSLCCFKYCLVATRIILSFFNLFTALLRLKLSLFFPGPTKLPGKIRGTFHILEKSEERRQLCRWSAQMHFVIGCLQT